MVFGGDEYGESLSCKRIKLAWGKVRSWRLRVGFG